MLAPNFLEIQLYGMVIVFARIQVHTSSYHTGISSSNALRLLWGIIRGRAVTTTQLALTKPSHTTLALPKLSIASPHIHSLTFIPPQQLFYVFKFNTTMRLTAVILALAAVVLAMPEASPDASPAPQFGKGKFGKGKGKGLGGLKGKFGKGKSGMGGFGKGKLGGGGDSAPADDAPE